MILSSLFFLAVIVCLSQATPVGRLTGSTLTFDDFETSAARKYLDLHIQRWRELGWLGFHLSGDSYGPYSCILGLERNPSLVSNKYIGNTSFANTAEVSLMKGVTEKSYLLKRSVRATLGPFQQLAETKVYLNGQREEGYRQFGASSYIMKQIGGSLSDLSLLNTAIKGAMDSYRYLAVQQTRYQHWRDLQSLLDGAHELRFVSGMVVIDDSIVFQTDLDEPHDIFLDPNFETPDKRVMKCVDITSEVFRDGIVDFKKHVDLIFALDTTELSGYSLLKRV